MVRDKIHNMSVFVQHEAETASSVEMIDGDCSKANPKPMRRAQIFPWTMMYSRWHSIEIFTFQQKEWSHQTHRICSINTQECRINDATQFKIMSLTWSNVAIDPRCHFSNHNVECLWSWENLSLGKATAFTAAPFTSRHENGSCSCNCWCWCWTRNEKNGDHLCETETEKECLESGIVLGSDDYCNCICICHCLFIVNPFNNSISLRPKKWKWKRRRISISKRNVLMTLLLLWMRTLPKAPIIELR